jgi:hypothetical protein
MLRQGAIGEFNIFLTFFHEAVNCAKDKMVVKNEILRKRSLQCPEEL